MFDIAIIGAGVVGGMIAREMTKYNLKVCILEKNNDVATGATRANSAIVHAGFDAKEGSLKAKLNVKGSEMMETVAKEFSNALTVSASGGKLTFDDVAVKFPLMADGQVTPISGPWILMKTLLGGFLTAACEEDDLLHLTIHDSYEEDALQLEIWLSAEDVPVCAEILYDGRRIVTMNVENFTFR